MPKVKMIDYRLLGEWARTYAKFTAESRRGSPPKGFSIELPPDVATAQDAHYVSGDTLPAVEMAFKQIIEEYNKEGLKREKVIVFDFKAGRRPKPAQRLTFDLANKKDHERASDLEDDLDDFNSWGDKPDPVRGIQLSWYIGDRVTYRHKVEFQDGKKSSEYVAPHQWMYWTEEREEFFKDLDKSLDALAKRASAILDQPGANFASLIDGGKGVALLGMDKK